MNLSLLLAMSASLVSGGQSLYDNPAAFRADVERAFRVAQESMGQHHVRLVYSESTPSSPCTIGARALPQELAGADVVIVCSNLSEAAANYPQVLFAVSHELAHHKLDHLRTGFARVRELLDEWTKNDKVAGESLEEKSARAVREIKPKVMPLVRRQELEADESAEGVLRQAGFHPLHGAFVLDRARRWEGRDELDLRLAQERIAALQRRAPRPLRLPSVGVFNP